MCEGGTLDEPVRFTVVISRDCFAIGRADDYTRASRVWRSPRRSLCWFCFADECVSSNEGTAAPVKNADLDCRHDLCTSGKCPQGMKAGHIKTPAVTFRVMNIL